MATRKQRVSLSIVHQGEEITGVAPLPVERLAKGCAIDSREHRGLIACSAAIARHTLAVTTPPGARALVLGHLGRADAWVTGAATVPEIKKARNEAFNALVGVEQKTLDAVSAGLARTKRKKETGLDRHGETVVHRHTMLAANYSVGTAIMTLDAITDPTRALNVVDQAAGAMAYNRAALGPANSSDFRAQAWAQAEWEGSRPGAPDIYPVGALAVQLFHEYLGAFWKDQSDGLRLHLAEFCEWALAPAAN